MVGGSKIAVYPASGSASLLIDGSVNVLVLVLVCASNGTATARFSEDTWEEARTEFVWSFVDSAGGGAGAEVEEGEEGE